MKRLLVKALKNVFDMEKEDAVAVAKTVERVFHGKDEVEDMTIEKEVRSLFYELHREKLLKLRREEYKEKTNYIRKFYWSFDYDAIKEAAYKKLERLEPYRVYKNIPEKAWLVHTYNT